MLIDANKTRGSLSVSVSVSVSLSEIEKLLAMGDLSTVTPWHLQPTCAILRRWAKGKT